MIMVRAGELQVTRHASRQDGPGQCATRECAHPEARHSSTERDAGLAGVSSRGGRSPLGGAEKRRRGRRDTLDLRERGADDADRRSDDDRRLALRRTTGDDAAHGAIGGVYRDAMRGAVLLDVRVRTAFRRCFRPRVCH